MADQDLNIHIKALDETAGALKNIQTVTGNLSAGFETAGRSMRSMGREIGQIGSAMVLAGTAITAPLLLAFNTASKYSPQIKQEIDDMAEQWDKMSISVATSMLPVMQDLESRVSKVVDAWASLSQAQRDNLVQTTLTAGGYLLFGGIAVKSFGEALRVGADLFLLMGKLAAGIGAVSGALAFMAGVEVTVANGEILIANAANRAAASVVAISLPMLGVYAAVVLLIAAMAKWQAVSDTVVSAAEVVWKAFWAVLIGVKLGFTGLAELAIDSIEKIVEAAAKITHLPFLKNWASDLDGVRTGFQNLASQDMAGIAKQMTDINSIVKTGQGDWSNTTDGWRLGITASTTAVKDFGAAATDAFSKASNAFKSLNQGVGSGVGGGGGNGGNTNTLMNGFLQSIQEAKGAWNQWEQAGQAAGKGIMNDLQTSIGGFFDNVFTGQLKKASQVFADFGNSLLKTFSNVIAQMITQWMASKLWSILGGGGGALAAFGGGAAAFAAPGASAVAGMVLHDGGPVIAHDGLAVDEVPAVLQSGEGVLSRQGMQNLANLNNGGGNTKGGQAPQINITPVIQAWDANDVMRNMTAITNAISNNIMNNGQIRTIMRQYQ